MSGERNGMSEIKKISLQKTVLFTPINYQRAKAREGERSLLHKETGGLPSFGSEPNGSTLIYL